MTSSEEMTFALYIDIVSIFHNILRELFQFDFSIDEHLKLLCLVCKIDKQRFWILQFDMEDCTLILNEIIFSRWVLFSKSFLIVL